MLGPLFSYLQAGATIFLYLQAGATIFLYPEAGATIFLPTGWGHYFLTYRLGPLFSYLQAGATILFVPTGRGHHFLTYRLGPPLFCTYRLGPPLFCTYRLGPPLFCTYRLGPPSSYLEAVASESQEPRFPAGTTSPAGSAGETHQTRHPLTPTLALQQRSEGNGVELLSHVNKLTSFSERTAAQEPSLHWILDETCASEVSDEGV